MITGLVILVARADGTFILPIIVDYLVYEDFRDGAFEVALLYSNMILTIIELV